MLLDDCKAETAGSASLEPAYEEQNGQENLKMKRTEELSDAIAKCRGKGLL